MDVLDKLVYMMSNIQKEIMSLIVQATHKRRTTLYSHDVGQAASFTVCRGGQCDIGAALFHWASFIYVRCRVGPRFAMTQL